MTEKDNYLENYVSASYQIGGKARTYRVEIYKVENNAGGLSGTIDKGSETRTMPVSPYNVADVYKTVSGTWIDSTEVGISSSKSYTANPAAMFEAVASDQQKQYRDIISGGNPKYEYKVTMELRGSALTMPTISLWTLPSDGGDAILRGGYQVMDGLSGSVYRTVTAPFKESQIGTTVTQGNLQINVKEQPGMSTCARADGTDYAIITGSNSMQVRMSPMWAGLYDFYAKNLKMVTRLHDASKPAVQYAAPMATTAYQKGDEAYITVIYNEPINSISGTPTLTLSSKLAEYFESPTYVNNGTGTNALVFKVKAKKDITADFNYSAEIMK